MTTINALRGRTRYPGVIDPKATWKQTLFPNSYSNLLLWYDWSLETAGVSKNSITDRSGRGINGSFGGARVPSAIVMDIDGINRGVMVGSDTRVDFTRQSIRTTVRVFMPTYIYHPWIWSDSNYYYYHPGNSGELFHSSYAHSSVRNGYWRVNGQSVNPTSEIVWTGNYKGKTVIVTGVNTGTVGANRIGFERTYTYPQFILCEDIAYSDAKTTAQLEALERELAHKWDIEDYAY